MRPDTMDPTKPNKHARHNAEGRLSRPGEEYPWEDLETTDMFRPFFRRQRTWLDASGEPMWIEMDCPSGALFRRWLRSNPPGYVGADTLSHFSSYLPGRPP